MLTKFYVFFTSWKGKVDLLYSAIRARPFRAVLKRKTRVRGKGARSITVIRPGYQFNVVVTKDMVFQKPYRAERQKRLFPRFFSETLAEFYGV